MCSKCDGQGACILVIRIKENGTIIGGYNPLGYYYDENHGEYDEYRYERYEQYGGYGGYDDYRGYERYRRKY
jgi:hypothetical protein